MRAVRPTPPGVVDVDVPDGTKRIGKDVLGQHLRWAKPEEAVP